MSDIPKAAEYLRTIQTLLKLAVDLLPRQKQQKRAPVKAQKMTPALKKKIAEYAKKNPDKPNREIGKHFNVDGGRVSEAIHEGEKG